MLAHGLQQYVEPSEQDNLHHRYPKLIASAFFSGKAGKRKPERCSCLSGFVFLSVSSSLSHSLVLYDTHIQHHSKATSGVLWKI